jgi:5-methylcytosine-specific restriction endonuclease McrA
MILKPCAALGCRALVPMGTTHCAAHAAAAKAEEGARKARFDARRSAAPWRRWYKLAAWRARAKAQLMAQPLCAMCAAKGLVKEASLADHVTPHRGEAALFWGGALQSLCWSCHSRDKQRAERAGVG